MPLVNPAFRAGGDISPSRFVAISSAADFTVVAAGASTTVRPFGISQDGSKFPQTNDGWGSGASTVAAETGDQLTVFGLGEVCLLDVDNSGTLAAPAISPGDYLISKADGQGVKWTTNGTGGSTADAPSLIGAIALEAPIAGVGSSLIRVQVVCFYHTP